MRIHRIRLKDFRGVGELEVPFDADGVTIVAGPNEIGKTSLTDAFWLLLREKDSARKAEIREAQPKGRDVGPFVEAELTIGGRRLRYRKRWLTQRRTELEILSPVSERLTGDDAHDRVRYLLAAETDMDLLEALRHQQGDDAHQAELSGSPSLIAALDAAAGAHAGAGDQDRLLDRVNEEYSRYFTPRGQVKLHRTELAADVDHARARQAEMAERLRDLDEASARAQRLAAVKEQLRADLPAAEAAVVRQSEVLAGIEALESRVQQLASGAQAAVAELTTAKVAEQERARLIRADSGARTAAALIAAQLEDAAGPLQTAHARERAAAASLEHAETTVRELEHDAARAASVLEFAQLRGERDRLSRLAVQLSATEDEAAAARTVLADIRVDEDLLHRITTAELTLRLARQRAETGRPTIEIQPLRDVEISLGGTTHDATPAAPIKAQISADTELVIGDVARVHLTPGLSPEDGEDLQRRIRVAQTSLAEHLERAGVPTVAEAQEQLRVREKAEHQLDLARQRLSDLLGEYDAAWVEDRLAQLDLVLAETEMAADEQGGASVQESIDAARSAAGAVTARLDAARHELTRRHSAKDAAADARQELESSHIRLITQRESAEWEMERAAEELTEARAGQPDEALTEALAQASAASVDAGHAHSLARRELADADPDSARALHESLQARADNMRDAIHQRELELASITSRLEVGGHEGLADQLAEAEAHVEELALRHAALERRAAAAGLLHDVLAAKREEAQQAYIGPFRDKVEAYARIIYGPRVRVTVDHQTLAITGRSIGGTEVAFAALSGGAREQLAILARLAAGALAAADGDGVPVILDDALGHTNPERLPQLWAALHNAGQGTQVIVLTCEEARYQGVSGARLVTLSPGEPRPAGPSPSMQDEGSVVQVEETRQLRRF